MHNLLRYLLGSALALYFALVLGLIFLGFFSAVLWVRGQQLNLRGASRWLSMLWRLMRVLPVVVLVLAIALSIYNAVHKKSADTTPKAPASNQSR